MNEQNDLMQEKILKKEKTDTIIAYVLLVIVLLAIGFIIYLKFIKKEDEITIPTDEQNDYITLADISDELNTSESLNKYNTDGNDFTIASNDDGLVITYKESDNTKTININKVENELEFKITNEEDKTFITDVYKETANIICKFYGNSADLCKSVIENINGNSEFEGIRFVNTDDEIYVYLDLTKGINIRDIETYSEVTNVDISNKNYQLKFDEITIKNIDIINSDTGISFTGTIKGENLNDKSVVVSLYNEDEELITSNEYKIENELTAKFNISFEYNDDLTYDSIKEYNISVK